MKNLYIHVPFCAEKCAYCAFYSAVGKEDLVDLFLKKLERQFVESSDICEPLQTIYIGGGTPTLLTATQLEWLFTSIRSSFQICSDAEISIECNPETLDAEKARVISQHATRVSMGLQTFDAVHRKMIGRSGSTDSVFAAIDLLKKSDFTNVSLDLIYAIPNQTLDDCERDLRAVAELGVNHVSAYSLSVEEGAELSGTNCEEAESDISFEMWELAEKVLSEYDLKRYEISNYAKPGFECRHNSNIWAGQSYLGLGPSAVSFDGEKRWEQAASIDAWLRDKSPEFDIIDSESRAREIFIMGLRTSKGWDRKQFEDATGFDYTPWLSALDLFEAHNFVNISDHSISLTAEGLAFWNTIAEELVC